MLRSLFEKHEMLSATSIDRLLAIVEELQKANHELKGAYVVQDPWNYADQIEELKKENAELKRWVNVKNEAIKIMKFVRRTHIDNNSKLEAEVRSLEERLKKYDGILFNLNLSPSDALENWQIIEEQFGKIKDLEERLKANNEAFKILKSVVDMDSKFLERLGKAEAVVAWAKGFHYYCPTLLHASCGLCSAIAAYDDAVKSKEKQ